MTTSAAVAPQVKKVVKKTPKVKVEASVKVEPVPEVISEETGEVVEEPKVNPLEDRVKNLLETVSALGKTLKEVEHELKAVRTLYIKEAKENNKKRRKNKKVKTGETRKNGFLKQTSVSPELSKFLGLTDGATISRPEVTKFISAYVKTNNLAQEGNKTIFKLDKPLEKLLGKPRFPISKKNPEAGNGYTYFNLQSYLKDKGHFLEAPATVVA